MAGKRQIKKRRDVATEAVRLSKRVYQAIEELKITPDEPINSVLERQPQIAEKLKHIK